MLSVNDMARISHILRSDAHSLMEAHNVYGRDDFQGEPEAHDDYRERMALAEKIDTAMARDREG